MIDSIGTLPPTTIGIDLGDKHSHLFVLDNVTGEVLEEGRVSTTPTAFERRFRAAGRARVVVEAGAHSRWVSTLLTECGHEVIVANPRKLQLITANDTKNDKADAERLAILGRADPRLLFPIQHRGPESQAALAVLRARDQLVKMRTQLVNHVRGTVKGFGVKLPAAAAKCFHRKVRQLLPAELRPALEPLIDHLDQLERSIQEYDRRIKRLARDEFPETARLAQVSGVGPITSLAFVLTLEDPFRFKNGRAVGSYAGLRPRQRDSGESQPKLGITKAGNGYLRRLLVTAAHYVLGHFGPDSDLRRWGLQLAGKGGKDKKRAVVAVARKLAVLLWKLWRTGEEYEPLREARRRAAKQETTLATSGAVA